MRWHQAVVMTPSRSTFVVMTPSRSTLPISSLSACKPADPRVRVGAEGHHEGLQEDAGGRVLEGTLQSARTRERD